MLLKKSDGNIICFDTFEIHPIVAVYGLLWYLNSIYGIILMIIESNNVCFFEWCPVCIVNATIPILWLIIITMVDSCCIKYWSLKKWHRRHYGAAFLYFAIFTNQLLIFGTLCFYGFSVWSTIATSACNASNHLYYGFIILISTSTLLILWIGFYQFYAATKYLCTYTAVLDVKRRQELSNHHLKTKNNGKSHGNTKNKLMFKKNGRKFSIESNSTHSTTNMSLSCIGSIFRYGSDPEDYDDIDINEHEPIQPNPSMVELKLNSNRFIHRERIDDAGNMRDIEVHPPLPPPPDPMSPRIININEAFPIITPSINHPVLITPLPSESAQLMDDGYINNNNNNNDELTMHEDELKEVSESLSESDSASPSKSHTHIEIAGIVIPIHKKGHKKKQKQHDHKRYKSVNNNNNKSEGIIHDKQHSLDINMNDNKDDDTKQEESNNDNDNKEEDIENKEENKLYSIPFFGKAIKITSTYFDSLKEDPSTADLCIICYDSFKRNDYLARLQCRHIFHKNCIRIWLANNHSCPLCNMNEKNINLKLNI